MKLKIYILFFITVISTSLHAQENTCTHERMKDYVVDGQSYKLVLQGADRGNVYFSFFDAFVYRVAICSSTHKNYKINLYDIQKKVLFSGTCEDYTKVLDLNFKSNIAGYIEIICDNQTGTDPVFQIMIGFKELKGEKNISKE